MCAVTASLQAGAGGLREPSGPPGGPGPVGRPACCCAPGAAAGLLTPQRVAGRRATRQTRRCPHTARREAPAGVALALPLPVGRKLCPESPPGWADRPGLKGSARGSPGPGPCTSFQHGAHLWFMASVKGSKGLRFKCSGSPGKREGLFLGRKHSWRNVLSIDAFGGPSSWPLCDKACH